MVPYRKRIREKTGLDTRVDYVRFAIEARLFEGEWEAP